jgi:K+-transporting ATPase KdpF subunit
MCVCPANEARDAGRSDDSLHGDFLCRGVSLRKSVPEAEVARMHIDLIAAIALALSILLLGYLVASLLFPEKF